MATEKYCSINVNIETFVIMTVSKSCCFNKDHLTVIPNSKEQSDASIPDISNGQAVLLPRPGDEIALPRIKIARDLALSLTPLYYIVLSS